MITWLYSQPWLLLTLSTLFWAGNAVSARLAVGEIAPFQLVLARWVIATGLLWFLFHRDVRACWSVVRPRLRWLILVSTIGFTIFNAVFYAAALTTTAVNIGILQGAMPVLVLVGAFIVHRTPVRGIQIAGVLLTLCGVVLVASAGSPAEIFSIGINPGDGLMLIASMAYAFYTVMLKERPLIPGTAFFTLASTVAMVTSFPLAIAEAVIVQPSMPSAPSWLIVLYVALFPSCLSQLFFLRGVDLIGPGRAGAYINLVPVFAALLAVLILGEHFRGYHALALIFVLCGIYLVQRAPKVASQMMSKG